MRSLHLLAMYLAITGPLAWHHAHTVWLNPESVSNMWMSAACANLQSG